MPIYEYECEKCGKISELLIYSKLEQASIECEHCGSKKVKKLISAPGKIDMGDNVSSNSGGSCPTCSSGTCGL